jgi:hypothetical protein
LALGDGLRRFFRDVGGPPTLDGIAELKVGDASYDDWEVVRDIGELEAARAWRQQLTDAGLEAVITSDHPLDEWGRGDIALRVPPGRWSEANELLDEP